jgi:hypothetical protein
MTTKNKFIGKRAASKHAMGAWPGPGEGRIFLFCLLEGK